MNNNFGISEKSYNYLVETFNKYPEIEEVIIFGSRAKGNYKKGSDIDIAIKGDKCSEELAINLASYIDDDLPIPYMVDVVNYDTIDNPDLKLSIDTFGKPFINVNSTQEIDYLLSNSTNTARLLKGIEEIEKIL